MIASPSIIPLVVHILPLRRPKNFDLFAEDEKKEPVNRTKRGYVGDL